MTETFRFPGRVYFLIAGCLVLCALTAPFLLIESTRHGPAASGEVILGSIPLVLVVLLGIAFWQTSPISVDEHRIARTCFGLEVQALRWDAVGAVSLDSPMTPADRPRRLVVVRSVDGRRRIGISGNVERFERLVSLIAEIASSHAIRIERNGGTGARSSA